MLDEMKTTRREREREHTGGNEVQIVVCVSGIETSIEV
jgi:hypothetical protein